MDMQPRSLRTRWYTSTSCYITSSSIGKSVHLLLGHTMYVWFSCKRHCVHLVKKAAALRTFWLCNVVAFIRWWKRSCHLLVMCCKLLHCQEIPWCSFTHKKWVPVTKAWHILRLQIEERPPIWRVAGCIVADSREGVFLELWGWMRW